MPTWNEVIRAFLAKTAPRDIVMLVNMILLCLAGAVMLIRTWVASGSFLAYGMGLGLLLAGLYRGCLVYKIVKQIRRVAP